MKSIFLAFAILLHFLSSPWHEFTIPSANSEQIQTELSEKLLRLHVIAASDSDEDQATKLLVKDETVSILQDLLSDCSDKEDFITTLSSYLPILQQTLQDFLFSINCPQTVTVSLEYTYFPVKLYGDLVFPSGFYDALRVVLEEGKGQNWWCVLYPPLCFTDVCTMSVPEQSKTQLEETLSDNAWNSIQMDCQTKNDTPKIRFWIVDFIKDIFAK